MGSPRTSALRTSAALSVPRRATPHVVSRSEPLLLVRDTVLLGDSIAILNSLPESSVDLILS